MNTNSAIPGSYTKNPFWKQKFDLRQIKKIRDGQPFVDFDAAGKLLRSCNDNESNELSR